MGTKHATINTTKKKHRHEPITMMRNMLLAIVLVLSVHAAIPRCTTCAKDLDACQPCFRRWRADQARYQQSAYYNPHDKRNQYDNPCIPFAPVTASTHSRAPEEMITSDTATTTATKTTG